MDVEFSVDALGMGSHGVFGDEQRFGNAGSNSACAADVALFVPHNLHVAQALVLIAAVALAANVACYLVQGSLALGMANSTVSVAVLVPHYYPCVFAFVVFASAGVLLDLVAVFRKRRLTLSRALFGAACALVGIFVMRFVFYMMHLTVGISL